MNTIRNEISLIAPPFSASPSPYISLPTLMGWLKQKGITTRFVDLARDLKEVLLSPDAITQAYNTLAETFIVLNERDELTPSEAFHIAEVQMLLKKLAPVFQDWKNDDFQKADRNLLMELITITHWPQYLRSIDGLQLRSQYDIYSSHDLISSGNDSFFFTSELKNLIRRQIDGARTLVAGISIVFDQQVIPGMQCARIIKELFPEIHVTLGGPFITIHLRHLQNEEFFKYVDSLILDEGEEPLVTLYNTLLQKPLHLHTVPNLVWRDETGIITRNKSAPFINLALLPAPDYNVCDLDRYPDAKNMQLTVRLSKGCYWKRCAFCRVNLSICRNYSQPDVDTIYQMLCDVIDSTGVTNYLFSDESCAPEILEQISDKLCAESRAIAWTFHTRIDSKRLTRKRVKKFKQAGCTGFTVGIESFNNRLLKLLNKGITEEEIEFVLKDLKGILPINAYMMLGLPTETDEEYIRSFHTLQQCMSDGLLAAFQYSLFNLAPGSLMWKKPERYGIRKVDSVNSSDLMPNNITCFESDGMSRFQAFKHYLMLMISKIPANMNEIPITINGKKHFTRYNPKNLVEAMGELFIKQLDVPFVTWLGQMDNKCATIRHQDPWWMF